MGNYVEGYDKMENHIPADADSGCDENKSTGQQGFI